MKVSAITFLVPLCIMSTTGVVSAQPFRLVNGKGEDILKAIANKPNEEATIPASRIRIPNTSASVAAPEKASKTSSSTVLDQKLVSLDMVDLHRRFGPTDESLTKDETTFLEDTIQNAYEKIHKDRDDIVRNAKNNNGLRGSQKSPFIPIDREVLKRYEQRIGNSF